MKQDLNVNLWPVPPRPLGVSELRAEIWRLETELKATKRQLEAAQATIRALQASNHVIFN